ncbi:unnamed protein product [Amoebophrya sp. A120]|nr:unnamed protein product [Amoebophrya sp. A120]|eukprot:GSA120T00004936001.1
MDQTLLPPATQNNDGIGDTVLPGGGATQPSGDQIADTKLPVQNTNVEQTQLAQTQFGGAAGSSGDTPPASTTVDQTQFGAGNNAMATQFATGAAATANDQTQFVTGQQQTQLDNTVMMGTTQRPQEMTSLDGTPNPGGGGNVHYTSEMAEWAFEPMLYVITAVGCFLSLLVPLLVVSYRISDGFTLFFLSLWFLLITFASLPVATWESVRPLSQAEIGTVIFNPVTAKDQDLFLQYVRRDLLLFVTWLAVFTVCCLLVVEYPILSRAILFVTVSLAAYFYGMTELLLNKFSNHPRRTLFHGPGVPSWLVPDAFLESKIVRSSYDFTRFGLCIFFFTSGILFGDYNRERSSGPYSVLSTGAFYGYVSDNASDKWDGTQFSFSAETKVDTFRSIGYRDAGSSYCVAPVLESAETKRPQYMWAVGKNCCLAKGDFWCTAERGYDLLESDDDALEAGDALPSTIAWKEASGKQQAVRAVVSDADNIAFMKAVRAAVAAYAFPSPPDEDTVKLVMWTKSNDDVISSLKSRGGKFVLFTLLFALFAGCVFALAPGAGITRKVKIVGRVERKRTGEPAQIGRLNMRK